MRERERERETETERERQRERETERETGERERERERERETESERVRERWFINSTCTSVFEAATASLIDLTSEHDSPPTTNKISKPWSDGRGLETLINKL